MNEEVRYRLLKLLSQNPELSQRDLAQKLGISLGKVNYCVRALKEKGLVKVNNFKNNPSKTGYLYMLTPKGIEEKAGVTARFFKRKLKEYEKLEEEIEQLRKEVIAIENAIE